MPKVSVIVPNYNHACFLERRMQSIFEQTYRDFEIIYLDDASTDESNEVIAKFLHHPHIRAFYNKKNSASPFKQWDKGVGLAKGEYIWIAEADDYADSSLLSELAACLDENSSVGLVYCQSQIVNEEEVVVSSTQEDTNNIDALRWKHDFINNGKDECSRYLFIQNTIPNASAVLFRRSLFEKVGGAKETLRMCGDWMLWVDILLNSDVAYVAKALNFFRIHQNTVRRRLREGTNIEDAARVMSHIRAHIYIPEDVCEYACKEFVRRWVNCFFSYPHRGQFKLSVRVYNMMKILDPRIHIHILQNLIRWAKNKTVILATKPYKTISFIIRLFKKRGRL